MGSSCEVNGKSIDSSVGGLVWVRRRNGSWWPGRILGPDELPESCLVSPRSGTPVKLLGREDASVDWYNLEKSKRVKAFRCGEYDECIEKAKVTAAISSKKAVKYARREDAILHALELETARISNNCPETKTARTSKNFPETETKTARISKNCSETKTARISENCPETKSARISRNCPKTKSSRLSDDCLETEAAQTSKNCPESKTARISKDCPESKTEQLSKSCPVTKTARISKNCPETRSTRISRDCLETKTARISKECPETKNAQISNGWPKTKSARISKDCPETETAQIFEDCPETRSGRISRDCPGTKTARTSKICLEVKTEYCPETTSQNNESGHKKPDPEDTPTHLEPDESSSLEYTSQQSPRAYTEDNSPIQRNDYSEEEGSKKRMRGLEDLGITNPQKKSKSLSTMIKRKRSQVAHVHEFLKKKNRRRQLTKVLESSTMVTVPVMCEELTGKNLPEGSENKMSRSLSVVINNNSDSTGGDVSPVDCKFKENEISSNLEFFEDGFFGRLYDVPFIGDEKQTAGFSPIFIPEKPQVILEGQSGQSSLIETVSVGPDEIQESGSISSGAGQLNDISAGQLNDIIITNNNNNIDNKTTSKWQHKGKRNSRSKTKTKIHKFLEPDNNIILPGQPTESNPVNDSVELTGSQRVNPYRQSRFMVNPKLESNYEKHDVDDLYNINIEVKSGHFPQHVPYISLMSKLTGQPITGHPILVEVLNDLGSDLSYSSSCELEQVKGEIVKKKKNGVLLNKKTRKLSSLTGLKSKRPSQTGQQPGKFKKPGEACVPLKVIFGRLSEAFGSNLS